MKFWGQGMDFDFSEEQSLLHDSVTRLLADRYGFAARKGFLAAPEGWSPAMWGHYADLGLLALPFAEEYGGFGLGATETMIVMEAFGAALALEPYLPSVILCGGILRHAASLEQKARFLPALLAGESRFALAQMEAQSRHDLADVALTAQRTGAGYVLQGAKSLVLHGDSADQFIVSARVSGTQRDGQGIGLFLVPADAGGVERRGYALQDGHRAAEVTFSAVEVAADAVLGEPEGGLPVLERALDEAVAALCAEAVGAMAVAHRLTVDYLKTRQQFGAPIGSFQALQHRAAEMLVALEQARGMALYATMMAQEPDAASRRRAMRAAKIQIGRSAKFITQQAVQLHGGVGVTMDYAIGHYFKRLTMIDTMFGDADHHLGLLAADPAGLLD